MATNFEFEKLRRRTDVVPVFACYIKLIIGGLLFIQDSTAARDIEQGQIMNANLPEGYDLPFDEADDRLILKEERLVKMFDPIIADGIQENLALKRAKRTKGGSKSIQLDNSDFALSKFWAQEPLLGREVFVKFGFTSLDYIFYEEYDRGTIDTIKYAKGKVTLTVS